MRKWYGDFSKPTPTQPYWITTMPATPTGSAAYPPRTRWTWWGPTTTDPCPGPASCLDWPSLPSGTGALIKWVLYTSSGDDGCGGGGVLTMGDYRDHYSRRGGCSGGWDFFSTIWYKLKLFIWWLVLCFIIIHVYLTIISKGTMELTSITVSLETIYGSQTWPWQIFGKIYHQVSKKYHSTQWMAHF